MVELRVETAIAQSEELLTKRTFTAPLKGKYSAVIQPRVNGYLLKKNYSDGMPVKKGQLLFTIDSRELINSQLSTAAELQAARADLIEAQNNYRRAVPLAKIEAISQSQLDSYAAQYEAAKAKVSSLEQSLSSAKLQVGYSRIYSPIDGVAAASVATEGDYVGPGSQYEVLTTISNIDTMTFELNLPVVEYLRLTKSDNKSYDNSAFIRSIKMQLSDGEEYPLEGAYDYTLKDIASAEGSITFVVKFANPDYRLKSGQYAKVSALLGSARSVVTIPAVALSQRQGIESVWVVGADSTVEYRAVRSERIEGERCIIDSGLMAGERVLTTGLQKVKNSQKIIY